MIRDGKDGTVRAELSDPEQRAVWTGEPAAMKKGEQKKGEIL